ncbi:oxygenase MpaB family protein [Acinetobacter sp. IRS14]|uniref:hypothetical protein n=1 Tax=Acinetobacter sp. IRS14 TaxID=2983398 RepID=UPI002AFEC92E|nr:hypothetical protein [Acinetobacter sp. IRS14]MEA1229539.1 oxygenase MpaB family protein [Acinetobacter sp. IRS14]
MNSLSQNMHSTYNADIPLPQRIAAAIELINHPIRDTVYPFADLDVQQINTLFETWDSVGDPLAENLIAELRKHKRMTKNLFQAARALEAEDNQAAVLFFKDVETVPEWFDFEETKASAEMSGRNILGFIFGLHSALPYTAVDGNIPSVFFATGRMNKKGDFVRRIWETAAGFIGVIDIEGMKPGGKQWEMWVRIRLMHSMVRLGLGVSNKWVGVRKGVPISVTGAIAGVYVMGRLRSKVMRAFGYVTKEELNSSIRIWQWVGKILGVPQEFFLQDFQQIKRLDQLGFNFFYSPTQLSQDFANEVYAGLEDVTKGFIPKSVNAAIGRYSLSPQCVLSPKNGHVANDLKIPKNIVLDLAITSLATVSRTASQINRVPFVGRINAHIGQKVLNKALEIGLNGLHAEFSTKMNNGSTCPV